MIEKIISLAAAKRKQLGQEPFKDVDSSEVVADRDIKPRSNGNEAKTINASASSPKIIGIGSSTGGPQALLNFLNGIKSNLSVPVVITQHMPSAFTKILAGHLSKATGLICEEAEDGMLLKAGQVYVAPGDHHMTISKEDGKFFVRLKFF